MSLSPVCKRRCPTCPWNEDSPYRALHRDLLISALTEASRECHSTGTNGVGGRTGKPTRICRGARDEQIQFMAGLGFIAEATDAAWDAKWAEIQGQRKKVKKSHRKC